MKSLRWVIEDEGVKVSNMRNLFLALTLFLAGCGSLNHEYVEADYLDYQVFKPLIQKWLDQEPGNVIPLDDPNLDDPEGYVDLLELKLETRGLRIEKAREALELE